MNIHELSEELKKLNIPSGWFSLEDKGIIDFKICLRFADNQWTVFYSERGGQFDLKTFGTEDAACKELLVRMKDKKERKERSSQETVQPKNKCFKDQLSELMSDMVSICLEYAQGVADKVFIYASYEGNKISCNFFYQVKGQLKKKYELNDNNDKPVDVSNTRQFSVLRILNKDIQTLIAACNEWKKPMPTEMKLVFDVKTKSLSANYQYEPVYSKTPDKDAVTISEEWFAQIAAELKGGKTNQVVLNHLLTEEKVTEKVALDIIHKQERHPDILEEFSKWIQTRKYPDQDAIRVEGYTAQMLGEHTHLRPVGAYNYLIYLREKPEEALDRLKRGLPIK